MPRDFLCGVVEGFYGRTWADGARRAWAGWLRQLGLNAYLYCPKADPYLRRRWPEHWPEDQWQALRSLSAWYAGQGLHFGVGLSPFELYRHYGRTERIRLRDKALRLAELEAPLLAVLFDDMPGAVADLAERQAEIVIDLAGWLPSARLLVCPTYYSTDPVLARHFGAMPGRYWQDLGAQLPPAVDTFWTGSRVCAEHIGRDELREMSAAFGRPLTLWDNYPVNDGAVRSRRLYLEPLPGREPGLGSELAGHFCNPMNQSWLSLPALRGLSRLHGRGEPPATWEGEVLGELLWRLLQRDGPGFREPGLDALDGRRREALAREYAALPGPAAAEVAGWLRGEYTFDPACLTD
ncbi:MAG: beta-N-acetylglucosaminidase domain-containing protein [Parahaliea sp.]